MSNSVDPNILGGWCKVGSKVVSDFYAGESDFIRTVLKVVVYPDGQSDRIKNSNGFVWTDGGYHEKTGKVGKPLERISFMDFVKPLPNTEI